MLLVTFMYVRAWYIQCTYHIHTRAGWDRSTSCCSTAAPRSTLQCVYSTPILETVKGRIFATPPPIDIVYAPVASSRTVSDTVFHDGMALHCSSFYYEVARPPVVLWYDVHAFCVCMKIFGSNSLATLENASKRNEHKPGDCGNAVEYQCKF